MTLVRSLKASVSILPTRNSATTRKLGVVVGSQLSNRFLSALSSLSHPEVAKLNQVYTARSMIRCSNPQISSSLACPTMPSSASRQLRWYTPMSKEEEEKEKARVSHLTPEDKDEELRKLNREIAKLEMLRGINNGELYTWSGRYKALLRDYGFPLFAYYWVTYGTMFVGTYAAITVGGLDAMDVISRFDQFTGFELANKVDPALGKIGITLVLNEAWEPIRLPFVITTLKPIMDTVNPPKF